MGFNARDAASLVVRKTQATPRIRLLLGLLFAITCLTVFSFHRNHFQYRQDVLQTLSFFHGKAMKAFGDTHQTPFPNSQIIYPTLSLDGDDESKSIRKPWLVAVMSDARDSHRRNMIRATRLHLYHDVPVETVFVLENPTQGLVESVQVENGTFGDIVIPDHLPEDVGVAKKVKSLEFLRWLRRSERKHEFVTKMDADVWLDMRSFWQQYLEPRSRKSEGGWTASVEKTIIGQLDYDKHLRIVHPQGSAYTMTWDVVEDLSALQDEFGFIAADGIDLALLMARSGERATVVNMPGSEYFGYDYSDTRGDGTGWARYSSHQQASQHAIWNDALIVSAAGDDEAWWEVANCFDDNGFSPSTRSVKQGVAATVRTLCDWGDWLGVSTCWGSAVDRIPWEFWGEEDGSGRVTCDEMWYVED